MKSTPRSFVPEDARGPRDAAGAAVTALAIVTILVGVASLLLREVSLGVLTLAVAALLLLLRSLAVQARRSNDLLERAVRELIAARAAATGHGNGAPRSPAFAAAPLPADDAAFTPARPQRGPAGD